MVAAPKPQCSRCKAVTTRAFQERNETDLCPRCFRVRDLPDYDDAKAVEVVLDARAGGLTWERVLGQLAKAMKPPAVARYWAPAHDWNTLDAHDLATRRLQWR